MEFIRGESREQIILLPDCIDDYVDDDNSVPVIEAYINSRLIEIVSVRLYEPDTLLTATGNGK
jgi:hypothetical protein